MWLVVSKNALASSQRGGRVGLREVSSLPQGASIPQAWGAGGEMAPHFRGREGVRREGSVPPFWAAQSEPTAGLTSRCFSPAPLQPNPPPIQASPVTALLRGLGAVKLTH